MGRRVLAGKRICLDFVESGMCESSSRRWCRKKILEEGGEIVNAVDKDLFCLISDMAKSPHGHNALLNEARRLQIPIIAPEDLVEFMKKNLAGKVPPSAPAKSALTKSFSQPHWIKFQDSQGRYAPFSESFAEWPAWRLPGESRDEKEADLKEEGDVDPERLAKEAASTDLQVLEDYSGERPTVCFICGVELATVAAQNRHELSEEHVKAMQKQYAIFDEALPPMALPPRLRAGDSPVRAKESETSAPIHSPPPPNMATSSLQVMGVEAEEVVEESMVEEVEEVEDRPCGSSRSSPVLVAGPSSPVQPRLSKYRHLRRIRQKLEEKKASLRSHRLELGQLKLRRWKELREALALQKAELHYLRHCPNHCLPPPTLHKYIVVASPICC